MNCLSCQKVFEITDKDRNFYKRFDVPDPTICPDCRFQKRLNFRNERTLYKRTSNLSGQSIISIYTPDSPYTVYSAEEWWSDKWDGIGQGRDFDFNRPFFDQFKELALRVPRIALFNVNPTNSDYCQQAYNNRNSYLCMVVKECEDCMYMTHSNNIKDSYDCSFLQNSELCYDCIDSEKLYACIGAQSCQNSSNLLYCYDCIGCHDCVGCYGLRNKQYFIMNKPYSKEEYEAKMKVLELNKYSKFLNCEKYFRDLAKTLPHRSSMNLNTENSTGDYLINAKDSHECFSAFEIQDCNYCTWIFNSHDCMDVYGMGYSEWILEGLGVENLNNCAFNTFVSDSSDAFYCDLSFYCHDIFGCVGLRNKRNCILNKQYSEEEYKSMKARIIEHMKKTGEWGQFFPVNLSPYKYNETAALYYFPLTREEALAKGYGWREPDKKEYAPQSYVIPEDLKDVSPDITKETLACIDCGKNYKILPNELAFYKKRIIPVPRKCLDCRYKDRIALRNPRRLWERKCEKCGNKIETTYATNRPEKVYCEKCYAEMVG